MCPRPPYFYRMPNISLRVSPDVRNCPTVIKSRDSGGGPYYPSGPYSACLPYNKRIKNQHCSCKGLIFDSASHPCVAVSQPLNSASHRVLTRDETAVVKGLICVGQEFKMTQYHC